MFIIAVTGKESKGAYSVQDGEGNQILYLFEEEDDARDIPRSLRIGVNMFIIAVAGKEREGAYSVQDGLGNQILYLFEEEDDAERYAMMLEDRDYPEMHVIEVEDEVMIKTCQMHSYNYTDIGSNDIVIPPDTGHDII